MDVTTASTPASAAWQTLALSWGFHARERGLPAHSLEREYIALLKQTGAFPMRQWGEAARAWTKYLPRWDRASLAQAMRALRQADLGAKDTRISSDEQLLSNLLCAMCTPPSTSRAAR